MWNGARYWKIANITLTVAALVLLWIWGGSAYQRFLAYEWAVIIWVAALALGAYFASKWSKAGESAAGVVWALFLVAVMLSIGRTAIIDATQYHHHNCWTIRESGDVAVWECTPDGGSPAQGSNWSSWTESGSSHLCRQIGTSSSGGTIWRCRYDEF